jgi:hypothetical protein
MSDDTEKSGEVGGGPGMMRLPRAVAALALAIAAFVSGCGVQPTGVNIAQTEPIDAGPSSSSLSSVPSQGAYPVSLFLFSKFNKGPGSMVVRMVPIPPGPMDLPSLIAEGSPYVEDGQYTSSVPPGITLKETSARHQYVVSSPTPLTPPAVQQLACTFDQYWLANPDKNKSVGPTTYFIGKGLDTGWQDCAGGLTPGASANGTGPAAKPTVPEGAKSTGAG